MTVHWTRDEIVLACALVYENDWRGLRAWQLPVRKLSALLRENAAGGHGIAEPAYRSVNSVQRKTFDLATRHPDYRGKPTKGGRGDREVLKQFLADPERMLAEAVEITELMRTDQLGVSDPTSQASEGDVLMRLHKTRERNPALRRAKIREATSGGRSLRCEVCRFDFEAMYGQIGAGYIEVHHVLPLHASGPTISRLRDLSLLCANCHRIVHRSRNWITPSHLLELLEDQNGDRVPALVPSDEPQS